MIVHLTVQAHPNARQERIQVLEGGVVAVWVRARPVAGAANAAIECLLARALGVRPRQVAVRGGQTAGRKTVAVEVESAIDVWERHAAEHRAG